MNSRDKDPQTYAVIGAAMAVHGHMGHGFLESVYQEALGIELESAGIPCEREVPIEIEYRGNVLSSSYRADLICYGDIIVEVKALGALNKAHCAQVINYLQATGYRRGLLINFGAPRLEWKRLVHGPQDEK